MRVAGGLALVVLIGACKAKDDGPKADPAARPKPAVSETVAAVETIYEDPMITAPSDGGPISAPSDVAAPPRDAIRSPSGLASKVLRTGTGSVHPGPADHVTAHYTGWTIDGKMFDSSVTRGEPFRAPLNALIKGWTEGLQLMVVGEQRRFWIPPELAYGSSHASGAPKGALVFDVELIAINAADAGP